MSTRSDTPKQRRPAESGRDAPEQIRRRAAPAVPGSALVGLRCASLPAISAVLALLLHAGGVVPIGLSGQLASATQLSATGYLAGLLARETASSVALRQDGTLSIDEHEDGPEPADAGSSWVGVSPADLTAAGYAAPERTVAKPALRSSATRRQPLLRAGLALSRTGHVSIVPPFVVLSRGSESIRLSLESGSGVVTEQRLPSWVSQTRPNGRVVADFGWRGTVEVQATSVSVRRRSLDWRIPGVTI